jgi:DNA repair exonuclease SbcCD nuclease subunit
VRLFVVPGNHDEYRPGSFWDRAQLPAAHVFTDYAFSSCRVSELQLVVWGAAMNPARTGERLLASFPGEPGAAGRSILLFHGNYLSYGPDDAPRYSPFDIDEARRLPVHYVAFGHHHGLREVLSERTLRAFYCGSPEAVSFGTSELGDRFVIRGEIADDGTVAAEPLKINSAEHAVETFDCTHETPESLARRAGELARPDRLLKLRLTGVCSPEVADAAASIQAELAAQFAYLEVTSDVADVDLAAEGNPYLKSFREEALRQLQQAPPDRRAVLRRALEIGALAFLRGHGGGGGRA